ncbi:DUF2306 domain-containing protein [Corallococcus exiguus]|uniref:DUF2306 domain-containing protein n=1 Tax=Corallococcus TaxID=83461 RepID=UPI000ED7CF36|nr:MULTISPECIES: DUF2306 domain-containing protein [Corallococcus]NNB97526.1 DUF2306 domain-containing protein [Corallococcus exiguus]NPC48789.1 DUF2306 domain-containing protein [Corallococcus exiguus]RKH85178.1 DUF2306 domain-containing protein [Corallococcus sp. AB032C]
MTRKARLFFFATLCVAVGLYPISYFLMGSTFGIRASKDEGLLAGLVWNAAFYTHISMGGLALAVGWTQFVERLRLRYSGAHRLIGKVYVGAAFLSGLSAVYIGFFATGGIVAASGFVSLGVVWLSTTASAYWLIKNRRVEKHRRMMTYSFAACFAAVTLRLWMPVLVHSLGDFISAYRIVAWLCWVPNLCVAYFITRRWPPEASPHLKTSLGERMG